MQGRYVTIFKLSNREEPGLGVSEDRKHRRIFEYKGDEIKIDCRKLHNEEHHKLYYKIK
jgi:hypothetical protein